MTGIANPISSRADLLVGILRYAMLFACVALMVTAAARGYWPGVGVGGWLAALMALDRWEEHQRRAGRHVRRLAQPLWGLTAIATLYAIYRR